MEQTADDEANGPCRPQDQADDDRQRVPAAVALVVLENTRLISLRRPEHESSQAAEKYQNKDPMRCLHQPTRESTSQDDRSEYQERVQGAFMPRRGERND